MFGFLRFILASIVLLNHLLSQMPFDLSVSAVVIFYLISGYTMGIKFKKYVDQTSNPKMLFFLDRLLRVFPLFILVLTSCLLMNSINYQLSTKQIILNYLLLPLNLYSVFDISLVLPITYSLALEEQFYLIMPFLLFSKKSDVILNLVAKLSLIFLSSVILLSLITYYTDTGAHFFGDKGFLFFTDYLIYRMLPGTLPIFILGICLNASSQAEERNSRLIWLSYLIIFFIVCIFSIANKGQIFAVSLGVLIGAPLVILLKNIRRTKFDDTIGGLSYPIFLLQGPIIASIRSMNLPVNTWIFNLLAFSITLLLSYIVSITFEKKISLFRSEFTKKFIQKHPKRKEVLL